MIWSSARRYGRGWRSIGNGARGVFVAGAGSAAGFQNGAMDTSKAPGNGGSSPKTAYEAIIQNDSGPGGQQEIEDSDSKVDVGRPARARHWNGRFSRNRDRHVKRLLLKFGKM